MLNPCLDIAIFQYVVGILNVLFVSCDFQPVNMTLNLIWFEFNGILYICETQFVNRIET